MADEELTAESDKDLIGATIELTGEAARFDGLVLPEDLARRLKPLKLCLT